MFAFLAFLMLAFATEEVVTDPPVDAAAPVAETAAPDSDAPPAEVGEAEEVVDTDDVLTVDAIVEQVPLAYRAFQDKNWPLGLGLVLSILVAIANRFGLKDFVGPKAVPWVATGLAVVSTMATALTLGVPVLESLTQGILAGVVAIGGWEMLLKHVMPKKASA
jgi:hypothetical protein